MDRESEYSWVPKKEAAAMLQVGLRQIERRVENGYVRKLVLDRKPSERSARVVYSRGDLEAILKGQPNNYPTLVKDGLPAAHDGNSNGAPAPPVEAVAVMPKKKRDDALTSPWRDLAVQLAAIASSRPAEKPWLTLQEAAEYSGLPARWLRARANAGEIPAINVASGKVKHWRFNREGLSRIP